MGYFIFLLLAVLAIGALIGLALSVVLIVGAVFVGLLVLRLTWAVILTLARGAWWWATDSWPEDVTARAEERQKLRAARRKARHAQRASKRNRPSPAVVAATEFSAARTAGSQQAVDLPSVRPRRAPTASDAPPLADKDYRDAILLVLLKGGGKGRAKEVTDALGERIGNRFSDHDREKLRSGDLRWRTRVQFITRQLKQEGLVESGAERGVWILTATGRQEADSISTGVLK